MRAANGSCVDVGVALYCKSGKRRSVATALILRRILQMEQWLVPEVRHLSDKYWGRGCCHGRCGECTESPTQLWESIQNAHTVWASQADQPQLALPSEPSSSSASGWCESMD